MRLRELPKWVLSNEQSVWRETEEARRWTSEQALERLAAACRAGAKLLELNDRRELVLRQRDPLPPSTAAALQRLQAEYRAKRAR